MVCKIEHGRTWCKWWVRDGSWWWTRTKSTTMRIFHELTVRGVTGRLWWAFHYNNIIKKEVITQWRIVVTQYYSRLT